MNITRNLNSEIDTKCAAESAVFTAVNESETKRRFKPNLEIVIPSPETIEISASETRRTVNIKLIRGIASELVKNAAKPKQTIIFLNIETLFTTTTQLGSSKWNAWISKVAEEWCDRLTYLVAHIVPVRPIEDRTVEVIRDLKKMGYNVCAFAARQQKQWSKLALKQLESIGLQFDDKAFRSRYPKLAKQPEYVNGVFFINEEKEKYLVRLLLRTFPNPPHVVFVDNDEEVVEEVSSSLSQQGISHNCLYYSPVEEDFNPMTAHTQLKELLGIKDKDAMPGDIQAFLKGHIQRGQIERVVKEKSLYKNPDGGCCS